MAKNSTSGASFQNNPQDSIPGFEFVQDFASWLKLDITTLAAVVTIFGMISGALGHLRGWGLNVYWFIIRSFTSSISIRGRDGRKLFHIDLMSLRHTLISKEPNNVMQTSGISPKAFLENQS